MIRRRLTAVVCAAALAIGAAGCGGSDDDEAAKTSTSNPARAADEKALAKISEQLSVIAREKDATAYCKLFHPAERKATMGSIEQCREVFQPLLERSTVTGDLVIEGIEFDGDEALVTYEGDGGTGRYEKIDGDWYIVAPSIENATPKVSQ